MPEVSGLAELASRRVQLRPLLPSDGEWVYALMCGPAGARWRYRGRTPSPEVVAADLWRGVFAQFVVSDRADGRPCGLVGLYNVALDAARGYGFALAEPDRATWVTEGFGLLCRWGFAQHGLERIFLEVPEFNLDHLASLGDAATVEGRLRNHDHWRGRYWDLFVLSLTPSTFDERFAAVLGRRIAESPEQAASPADVEAMVAACWPLDSLGLVEVLDALESCVGAPVDQDLLLAIDEQDPQRWSAEALRRVGVDRADEDRTSGDDTA